MIKKTLENLRAKKPLVHNITNYVTVNDCANAILAIGGSPIMADDKDEAKDITSICNALNINIGTLNKSTIPAMFEAGKISNSLSHPVLLDPVGAGASALRTQTSKELIKEIKFCAIRGNISEIKALALGDNSTKGVDADIADEITEETIDDVILFARDFSKKTGAVIIITGAIDLIVDENKAYVVRNGNAMMSRITGTGCMLSAIMCAFIAANRENITDACMSAVCAMGLCGELAYKRLSPKDGNAMYRNYIIDELYNLTPQILKEGAKYEMR